MKRIINGKIYNTETAELIGSDDANCPTTDFQWWEESLYVTKRGAYFLAGTGGPLSHYAVPCGGNGSTGGSKIQVISREQAMIWCEKHDQEALETHFSDNLEEA